MSASIIVISIHCCNALNYYCIPLSAFVKAPLCDNLDLDLESYGGSKPD